MPRQARLIVPYVPHHITHRSNSRQTIFHTEKDFTQYLKLMEKGLEKEAVEINAFCIMSNHVHIIVTPFQSESLSRYMAFVQRAYASYFNAVNMREGHLWKERFYSCPIGETWLDCAYHYVIENPVRAKLVSAAEQYRWSSVGAHDRDLDQCPNLFVNDYSRLGRKFSLEGIEEFRKSTRSGKPFQGTECHVTK